MLKRFIIILIAPVLLLACKSTESNPDVDYFLEELDGMSLEEAVEYIKEQNTEYQKFIGLFDVSSSFSFDSETKKYAKDEESYDELPEFMSGEAAEREANECLAGIYMTQNYKYPKTEIRIDGDVVGAKVSLTHRAKCIYFHDGSVDTTSQVISNWMDLDTPKVIDSILVKTYYSYATGYNKYEVKDKLKIEGGSIEITKKEDNMVTVHFKGAATKYNEIAALNEDGDVLRLSSSNGETKGADKVVKLYAKAFDKLVGKADKFKSVEELKEAVKKTVSKLPPLYNENNDATYIYNGFFKGNVNSIIVYIPKDKVSKEVDVTLKNRTVCKQNLIFVEDTDTKKSGFMNQAGELVIEPTYTDLYSVNNLYYYFNQEDDDENDISGYYYLDTENKELVRIMDVLDMEHVSPVCVLVEKDEKYALWGNEGKPITGYIYEYVEGINDELIQVWIDNKMGLLNSAGKMVQPIVYSSIEKFSDGLALLTKNREPQMFIDELGNEVLSVAQYTDATAFTEGLIGVRNKKDLYGFIDKMGKTVLPFIYNDAKHFSYGITIVSTDEGRGLIDKKGHFIVPATSSSYSMSESFGKREYYLDGVSYNEYGNVVVKDDED